MSCYFEKENSIYCRNNRRPKDVIKTVANRFISDNPKADIVYRAFNIKGILSDSLGRYIMDFDKIFPSAMEGSYCYAASFLYFNEAVGFGLTIRCLGETEVFLNGEKVASTCFEDESSENFSDRWVTGKKGYNTIFIKSKKSPIGFGCMIGTNNPKWVPLDFYSPFKNRTGDFGWIYSDPVSHDVYKEHIPDWFGEQDTRVCWNPVVEEDSAFQTFDLEEIFKDGGNGCYAFGNIVTEKIRQRLFFKGNVQGECSVWLDKAEIFKGSGEFERVCDAGIGAHRIAVKSENSNHLNFSLKITDDKNEEIEMHAFDFVKSKRYKWIFAEYAGDLAADFEREFHHIRWQVSTPNVILRPFIDTALFGKATYPLGVAMYGFIKAADFLSDDHIKDYVVNNINTCMDTYLISLNEVSALGYPSMNHQLVLMDSLDDCGSFGSALLEGYQVCRHPAIVKIGDRIADHMMNVQERTQEGAFMRLHSMWHKNTLWADDLYMSVPFLIRYYQQTGKKEYLDLAREQFLRFKEYLWMEDKKLMSHVYHFGKKKATRIPWGRGNGWVLFSLSEILEVKEDKELLDFYKEFTKSILDYQDSSGMWHQIIDEEDAYIETSCTAMYIYAISRGIRNGWIHEDKDRTIAAVLNAWEALTKYSIDYLGNIYGVCMGSSYSYRREYYKSELLTRKNDTHGTGIVILAGIETQKMLDYLAACTK